MSRRWFTTPMLVAALITGVAVVAPSPQARADAVITCTPNLEYPHASTHEKGTVNVVLTVSCNGPVDTISSTINLYRDGQRVASHYFPVEGSGIISYSNNTAEPCQSQHIYSADAGITVWFPAYYNGHRVTPGTVTQILPRTPDFVITCYAMAGGSQLDPYKMLVSRYNGWRLSMQGDGNLVVYGPRGASWSTCTERWPGSVAQMQSDGNFVVYGPGHVARWATGTSIPGSRIEMQDDGNLVVYSSSGIPLWSSWQHQRLC
jgi:hypothetical protein